MRKQILANAALVRLDVRLIAAVSRKLGTANVTLTRWVTDPKTYAQTPVFRVPEGSIATAQALGLTVECA